MQKERRKEEGGGRPLPLSLLPPAGVSPACSCCLLCKSACSASCLSCLSYGRRRRGVSPLYIFSGDAITTRCGEICRLEGGRRDSASWEEEEFSLYISGISISLLSVEDIA